MWRDGLYAVGLLKKKRHALEQRLHLDKFHVPGPAMIQSRRLRPNSSSQRQASVGVRTTPRGHKLNRAHGQTRTSQRRTRTPRQSQCIILSSKRHPKRVAVSTTELRQHQATDNCARVFPVKGQRDALRELLRRPTSCPTSHPRSRNLAELGKKPSFKGFLYYTLGIHPLGIDPHLSTFPDKPCYWVISQGCNPRV